jgi:hypothetical protein
LKCLEVGDLGVASVEDMKKGFLGVTAMGADIRRTIVFLIFNICVEETM